MKKNKIKQKNLKDIYQDNMMEYSSYILLNRVIPDIRDGLKPVYRRILYTMYRDKVNSLTKAEPVSAEVMKIHPHGDPYGTIVGMSQDDRHLYPFVTGKGNFGLYSSNSFDPAASRYTEIRLNDFSRMLMEDLDKKSVPFIDNYDSTQKIPSVLPVKFPIVLTTAQQGIGVGMSSRTGSFNIQDIGRILIQHLEGKNMDLIYPDFPLSGDIIYEKDVAKSLNSEGRGSVRLRGKAFIDGNSIKIKEVPYGITIERVMNKIIELASTPQLEEVIDVKNLTGLNNLEIRVEARDGTDMELLLEKLYQLTNLESRYSFNMNILGLDGLPKVMGVHTIIKDWSKWRREVLSLELENELAELNKKINVLNGLNIIKNNLDNVISIIRNSKREDIELSLMKEFKINEEQATYISRLRIRTLNKDILQERIDELNDLIKRKEEIEAILKDKSKINELIIEQIKKVMKEFNLERQAKIVNPPKVTDIRQKIEKELIEDKDYNIYLTELGYIYKFEKSSSKPFIQPNDKILKEIKLNNHDTIVSLDENKEGWKIKVHEIDESKEEELGFFMMSHFNKDVNIVDYLVLSDKYSHVLLFYKNGKGTKVPIESFYPGVNTFKNAYNNNFELDSTFLVKKDKVTKVEVTIDGYKPFKVTSDNFNETKGRANQGVYLRRRGKLKEVKEI